MSTIQRTLDLFGPKCLGHGLFYACPPGLRFELNSGGSHLEMFVQSWDRSRAIMAGTFPAGYSGHAILTTSVDDRGAKFDRHLRRCGIEIPPDREIQDIELEDPYDEGEMSRQMRIAFPVGFDSPLARAILWTALSGDVGVSPSALVSVYFVDLKRELLFHPYDDRGADLISPRVDALRPAYESLTDWLLPHDIERMKLQFEGAG